MLATRAAARRSALIRASPNPTRASSPLPPGTREALDEVSPNKGKGSLGVIGDAWRQHPAQLGEKGAASRLAGQVALELGAADTELVGPKIGLEGFNDSGRAQATTGPRISEVEEVAPAST